LSHLKTKTLNGLYWSFADSFGGKILQFGFGIAIARELSPSDYGIMGMIAIFLALGNILTESGFGMALIQKKNAVDDDFSTVFWFNLIVASIIYVVLFFSAGLISEFYNQPILVSVTRIAAFSIVLNALGIIHYTVLTKNVDFKKQTIVRFIAIIPTGIVGVILAYKGFAVWALVIQSLAGGVITTFGIWFVHKWRPRFVFSLTSFKELYSYGYKVFLSGLMDNLFSQIYFPLIGKYFPVAQLGFYVKAEGFYRLIVRQTAIAYGKVTFPALSSINQDKERYLQAYFKIYRLLAFIMFPITIVSIAVSEPLIDFLLKEKWMPIVPLMKIFLLEGFFFGLYMLNINTFYALGKSEFPLKLEFLKKSLVLLSIFIAFQFGIEALIIGQVICSFIVFILSTIKIIKFLDIRFLSQLNQMINLIIVSVFTILFNLYVLGYLSDISSAFIVINKIALLSVFYIGLTLLINRKMLLEFLLLFENKMPLKIKTYISTLK
jgi:teichuronic acid exporter